MGFKVEKSKAVIITVNYKSADSVLAFLAGLERTEACSEIEMIIVNNSPGEDNLSKIRPAAGKYANAKVIQSPTNRGYFGGARFALDHYLEQGNALAELVVVCNYHIQIEDKEFFSKVLFPDSVTPRHISPRHWTKSRRKDHNAILLPRAS